MIHSVIKSNQPIGRIIAPAIMLLCAIPFFLKSDFTYLSPFSIFSDLNDYLATSNVTLLKIIKMVIVIVSAMTLHNIIESIELDRYKSHGTLYWLIFFNTLFFNANVDISITFANLFLILSFRRIVSVYRDKKAYSVAFDASFFIGVATLFNVFYALLILFVIFSLTTLKTLNTREIILCLIGFIAPIAITAFCFYLFDIQATLPFEKITWNSANVLTNSTRNGLSIAASIVTMAVIVLGILKLMSETRSEKVRISNLLQTVLAMSVVMALVQILNRTNGSEDTAIVVLSVPISILMMYFQSGRKRQWIPISLFYIWLILTVLSVVSKI